MNTTVRGERWPLWFGILALLVQAPVLNVAALLALTLLRALPA